MSGLSNKKKAAQLGMPQGTAANRLRKIIIFNLLKEAGKNFCFQCGGEIESVDELSIEHKIPWLDSKDPIEMYFDLDNIAFSHLECNVRAARKGVEAEHPSLYSYRKGCRCDACKKISSENRKRQRNNKKLLEGNL
jgi:hypothetical protein